MTFEDVEAARQKCDVQDKELFKKRRKVIFVASAIVFPLEIIIFLFFFFKENPDIAITHFLLLLVPIVLVLAFELFFISVIVCLVTWKDTSVKTEHLIAYKRAYKAYFIQRQLAKFFTDIQYYHDKGLDKSILKESGLIDTGNIYKSNDLVRAKYKKTNFIQADVEIIERIEEHDKDGNEEVHYVTTFEGRYLVFEFPKKFDYKMTVSYYGHGSYYINPKTGRGLSLIETESPNFNKHFLVYAEDGFEAFYILTPDILDKIEKLGEKYKNALSLIFSNNRLYVGLNDGNDTFEPPHPSEPINEKEEEQKIIKDIELITDLVDSLKLDR